MQDIICELQDMKHLDWAARKVLRNDEEDSVRMAPLFDQGVSLLFSTYGDQREFSTSVLVDSGLNVFRNSVSAISRCPFCHGCVSETSSSTASG